MVNNPSMLQFQLMSQMNNPMINPMLIPQGMMMNAPYSFNGNQNMNLMNYNTNPLIYGNNHLANSNNSHISATLHDSLKKPEKR